MKSLLLIIIHLLFLHICHAQYVVKGRVINNAHEPLQSVTIKAEGIAQAGTTDSAGNFIVTAALPAVKAVLSMTGYKSRRVVMNATENNEIVLQKDEVDLNEVTVRAFESNTDVRHAPAAVTILNRAALDRYGNTSFVPALNAVPGVRMDERSPASYRLSIRGNLLRSTFGVRNVKVYWNGIPFTDANGNTYLNEISFNNIGRIEVIKGPSGSMYGAGTGGVVLLTNPAEKEKGRYMTLQSSAGSYGLFTTNGAYNNVGIDNNTSVSFAHQQSEGYREQAAMRRDVANYTGTFTVNAKQQLSANIFYSDLYYETPGGLTAAEMAANPKQDRPAAGIFKSAAAQKAALYLKTFYAGLGNTFRFNNNWSNTTSLYISNTRFKNPAIRNYERKTEQGAGMRSVLNYNRGIFTGTFGGEYQYTFTNTATYGNRLGISDTLQYHDEIGSRLFNVFLQTEVRVEKFIVSTGISYNNYHYGLLRVSDPGSVQKSSDFTPQFVPRIAVSRDINDRLNIYASVSKGYSPPSIDEVHASDGRFNIGLLAETGINYEAGLRSALADNRLRADVTYYIFHLQNTIVSRRDASGADYYVNAGKTNQRGLEAALNYQAINRENGFLRQLKTWASYTYIHARFAEYQQGTAKYDGNKLTGTPPNVFVAGLDLNVAAGFFGNLVYSYTDAIPLNDANTFFAAHYNLLSSKAGFRTDPDKKVSAEIYIAAEKSFNTPYSLGNDLNAAGNRYFNPSAPQQFTAGIKLRVNTGRN